MYRSTYPGAALAALLLFCPLTAGCAATPGTVPTAPFSSVPTASRLPPGAAADPSAVAPGAGGAHGRRGGTASGSPAAAGSLPADWPPDLPLPAGSITGFTGSAGRWTVLIVAGGSAAEVRRSALALYEAAGFTAVSDSVLNKGSRQITLAVENLDHSATQTNLMIGVTTT